MSEDCRSDEDPIMDLWYTNWEQQCVEAIEAEPDYEGQLHTSKELYSHQIWTGFQTTASAIAQLYKDRTQGASLWIPFQTAAGTVTSLYKDSVDGMRRCSDIGVEMGKQKRSKEIMNWARKKRRTIRREDLLAYLAGKPPPPRPHSHRSSPKPRMMVCGSPPSQSPAPSMVVSPAPASGNEGDPELHTFREAIALSETLRNEDTRLIYAIRKSVEGSEDERLAVRIKQRIVHNARLKQLEVHGTHRSPQHSYASLGSVGVAKFRICLVHETLIKSYLCLDSKKWTDFELEALEGSPISRRGGRQTELSAFISSEFARHHKRPASHDVDMGSPTHKRSRFM